MKIICYIVIIIVVSLQVTCASFGQEKVYKQVKFERMPFQKSLHVIKQPRKVDRTIEYGKSYKSNTRVVEVDRETGKYEFRWMGIDGKEKMLPYQRPDAIHALVKANVEEIKDGKFIYNYDFKVLDTSPIYFRNFIVQTFGTSLEVLNLDKERILFGKMSNVYEFSEGLWWSWGYMGSEKDRIHGGGSLKFHFSSDNPPGVTYCKAGGGEYGITTEIAEDPPSELEDEIPINTDLARGYTLGPDARLKKFSPPDKIKYLLDSLPKFQEAGWMSEGTAKNYGQILKRNDLKGAFEKAKKDFANEFISNEVFQIIEGLSQQRL